jgi:hypothetical protein
MGGQRLVPAVLPFGKKNRVPIIQLVGWARGPLWTGAENLTHTGIRSWDRQARSESNVNTSYTNAIIADLYSKMFFKCALDIMKTCLKRKNLQDPNFKYLYEKKPACNRKQIIPSVFRYRQVSLNYENIIKVLCVFYKVFCFYWVQACVQLIGLH